ncbi:MAG: hypothetical protein ACNYWM_07710 [Methanosarcinales archaeon]
MSHSGSSCRRPWHYQNEAADAHGEAFIANEGKRIVLEMNPKEPELMDKLNKGLYILNTMNICDSDGHSIRFNM